MAQPFLKWAGGKRQLMKKIELRLPDDLDSYNTYVEPFIGGGAVLFHLLEKYDFDNVHISDLNPELILCYEILKLDAKSVIKTLNKLIDEYPEEIDDRKEVYYKIRADWNEDVDNIKSLSKSKKVKRVSQMIFLNRTCFNGLFRVNRKGEFNVPIGNYKKPSFPKAENLLAVQKALENVTIHLSSFENCESWVDKYTFIYFDPPYRPLSDTSHFVSYSKGEFNDENQKQLAETFRSLDEKNIKLLLSNSDPKNTVPDDEFFDELYSGFNIQRVTANRAINSNPDRRGNITELLISNYY
jgi:DNA adenine methylase